MNIDQEVWDTAVAHYTKLSMGPGCDGHAKLKEALQAIIPLIERNARIDELTRWLEPVQNSGAAYKPLEEEMLIRLEQLVDHRE